MMVRLPRAESGTRKTQAGRGNRLDREIRDADRVEPGQHAGYRFFFFFLSFFFFSFSQRFVHLPSTQWEHGMGRSPICL
jgi:hypothetical protein